MLLNCRIAQALAAIFCANEATDNRRNRPISQSKGPDMEQMYPAPLIVECHPKNGVTH